mmetsp:Transcript_38479/g.108757  ORF Transcript_38479/g.108757 Transcript_38479/m.108757 type:complete len:220 (+) Transcript_38479:209-868(+)
MGEATLRVIGAGPGRTGTASLKAALEKLGFGPCYHMSETIANGDQLAWVKALSGQKKPPPEKLTEILSGYQSSLDFPSCVAYTELMEAFPEAKVRSDSRKSLPMPPIAVAVALSTAMPTCKTGEGFVLNAVSLPGDPHHPQCQELGTQRQGDHLQPIQPGKVLVHHAMEASPSPAGPSLPQPLLLKENATQSTPRYAQERDCTREGNSNMEPKCDQLCA